MTGKLILTHGIMGCGKSTWAKQEFNKDPNNVVIIERDNIREQLFGKKYHNRTPDHKSEKQVNQVQKHLICDNLAKGKNVIIADTNVNTRTIAGLANLAKTYNSEIEQKYFDVPLEECIRRNNLRGEKGERMVPEEIIRNAASRAYDEDGHLKEFVIGSNGNVSAVPRNTPGSLLVDEFNNQMIEENPLRGKAVVLLDVDGTLVNNQFDAYTYLNNSRKKNFPAFYKGITNAPFNQAVLKLVKDMREKDNLNIVVSTGRDDEYAAELIQKLRDSGLPISKLMMKKQGDFSPSSDQKLRNIKKLSDDGLIVVHAIDDRQKDLEMFSKMGIMTSAIIIPEINDNYMSNNDVPEPVVNTIYGSGYCIRCGSPLKKGNIGKRCAEKMSI